MTYTRNRDAFIADVTAAAKKHGFVFNGCGCCDSPWIDEIEKADNYNSIPSARHLGQEDPEEAVETFKWDPKDPS